MNAILANLQGEEEKVSPQPGEGGGGTDIKYNSPFSVVPPLVTFIELLYSYVFTLFGKILLHSCLAEFLKTFSAK